MKRLAWKRFQCRRERRVAHLRPEGTAVHGVTNEWPPSCSQVDADLVLATGDEAAAEQREARRGRRSSSHPGIQGQACGAIRIVCLERHDATAIAGV